MDMLLCFCDIAEKKVVFQLNTKIENNNKRKSK